MSTLPLDTVEQLQRFVPNDSEAKAFKQYEKDKRPIDKLTNEDKLMMQVYHDFVMICTNEGQKMPSQTI